MTRIFLYNWPIYIGTWLGAIALVAMAQFISVRAFELAVIAGGGAIAWSVVSLAVSFYVYDVSPLVSGAWAARLFGVPVSTWATIHAGLDAEVDWDAVMKGRCVARLDIFDPKVMTSPSITRARKVTPRTKDASACDPTALPLESGGCDAIVIAFTAHEIRDRRARETFFDELHRALKPGGTALVVEHLRDVANFAAFGPGFLHFVSRREWRRLASHAGLAVASETRVTPFVTAFALERAP